MKKIIMHVLSFNFPIVFIQIPSEVAAAGNQVLTACKKNGVFFLDNVLPYNVFSQVDKGVMIGAERREDSAEMGRKYAKRRIPL